MWGDARVDAEGTLDLTAVKGVRIRCGDSVISLTGDHIEIKSKRVSLLASDELLAQGDGPTLHLSDRAELNADDVRLHGSGSSVRLDAEAKVKGSAVKLQSNADSASESSDSAKAETRHVEVRAVDDAHRALAHRKYELRVQGQTLRGTTDGDGVVSVDVPKDARVMKLTVWPDAPPKRRALSWDLREFQRIQGLTESGALDDDTRTKLAQVPDRTSTG